LDFVFFIKNARIYSLSLSLTFFRYSSRVERWRETAERERERGRRRSDCVRARTLSLSFSLVRDFSLAARVSLPARGAGNDEGIKREREKGFIANENAQKRAKYGPDDFDVALVVSSSSARTFYDNTANDDFKSVLPPVCPVTFGAFLRPNVPAGHQRATAKIHLSNRDE
jgi:hypothetical protein